MHLLTRLVSITLLVAQPPLFAAVQAGHEAQIKEANTVLIGKQQTHLSPGTVVEVLSLTGGRAIISFAGPDGSPNITQIDASLLGDAPVPASIKSVVPVLPPGASPSTPVSFTPIRLRCEYRVNPLGIDSTNPRLDWILQPGDPLARGLASSAYRILVASSPDVLATNKGDLWDSGRVSSDQMNQIAYAGQPFQSSQAVWWKVRVWNQAGTSSDWSAVAQWTMGVLSEEDWQSAKWIGAPDANQPVDPKGPKPKYETVLLRHEFTVKPGLKRALVHICGLGQYEMMLNGAKVGNDLLSPGWTEYKKTCLYNTYDVTSSLQIGTNAIGLFLGNGFFNVHQGRYTKVTGSFGPLQTIGLIRLEYNDGSIQNVITDENWKVNSGPITFSSIYGGEDYDARLAQPDWDKIGFNDGQWDSPAVTQGPGGALKGLSCAAPPIRCTGVLTPVGNQKISPQVTVYDLGQNASLMLEMHVKGPKGSSIKVTPSELVNTNGDINDTLCSGDSYWTYTLNGDGDETYRSRFYYRGGRYLRVELKPVDGSQELPQVESMQENIIRADSPTVGDFSCSNDIYSKVFTLIRWAQMNNMLSIMTDCPTREKLGWLEEDHLNGPALRYNFDMAALFNKMVNDMFDAQRGNGLVPSLVPNYYNWDEGKFTTPIEWGSSCIIVPWQQYQFDGDIGLLRQRYEAMKNYIAYVNRRADSNIVSFGLGDWYDNHSEGEPTLTPVALTDTAFYYNDYMILTQIAQLVGNTDEATKFAAQAELIRTAFNAKFFNSSTNNYAAGAQGSNCLPLAMGIVEPENRRAVFDNLVKDVEAKGTTTGEVSFEYLLKALAQGGRSDLIYSTYSTDTQGYGLQVKLGKTSLTEGWNGGASQDHFMFGQINEWFYRELAGIQLDPAGPGFQKILIKPALVGDLTWVKASYDSICGTIVSKWTHSPTGLTLNITIPIGSTATIYVPAANADLVKEGDLAASLAPGVKYLRMESGAAVYAVGSGSYAFSSADAAVTPPGFTSQAGSGQVSLSWTASANAADYTLKRSATGDTNYQAIAQNLKETTYIDRGLENNKTYYYSLSAGNAFGESPGTETSATPAIIVDGGFEKPSVSDFAYKPAGSAWLFNDKSGISSPHSGMTGENPTGPPEGRQVAFVQQDGVISQIIGGLVPGTSYTLTFSAAQRVSSSPNGQTWQIKLDDTVIGDYSPPKEASTYTDYTATFTATAASQTFSFVGTNTRGGDNTIFIDDVRIHRSAQ
jgi:alpha-L-rhamnosidase